MDWKQVFNSNSVFINSDEFSFVIENKRAPVVAHMIWYNFGSGVEEKGKSGLAHFMEHLMFKGTKKNPGGTFSEVISKTIE